MRKRLISKLLSTYISTFPPLDMNGNNIIGRFKRMVIARTMFIVGGRKTNELIYEILKEFNEYCESLKEDQA